LSCSSNFLNIDIILTTQIQSLISSPEERNDALVMIRGRVYKYKSIKEDKFSQVVEIIRDCSLYFAKPSQFQDKYELKPVVTVGDITDPIYRQAVSKWVEGVLRLNSPDIKDEEIANELNSLTQERLESFAQQFEPGYSESIRSQYRILSLGDSDDNHHLWLHYADNFSGICFGFYIDETVLSLYRVKYSQNPASFDIASKQEYELLKASVLTKSQEWRFEAEIRGILRDPPLPEGPSLLNQRLRIPRDRIFAIYIGFRMPPKTRTRVIKLIRKYFPLIKLYEVRGGVPFIRAEIREILPPKRPSKFV